MKSEVIELLNCYHKSSHTTKGKFGEILQRQLDSWIKKNL